MSTGSEWIGKACALGKPLNLMQSAKKKVTFDVTTNGALSGAIELFTVGGTIGVMCFGVCDSDLTALSGAATLSLGTANATQHFISGTTATTIDSGEIWVPGAAAAEVLYSGAASHWSIVKDTDIGYEVGSYIIGGGSMTFYAYWTPISDGAWLEVQDVANTAM